MSIIVVVAHSSPLTGQLRGVTDAEVVAVKPGLADNVMKSMLATNRKVELALIAEDIDDGSLEELGYIVMDYFDVPVVVVRNDSDPLTMELRRAGYVESFNSAATEIELQRMVSRYLGGGAAAYVPSAPAPPRSAPQRSAPKAAPRRDDAPSAASRLDFGSVSSAATATDKRRVVVVMSPKGGVGKTTMSTNLAVSLSHRAPLDTVIVDFDSQFGDVGSVLNINAAHTLEDAFTEDGVQSSLVVKGMLNSFEDQLLVLSGSESPAALEKVTAAQESLLLRQLSDEYSFIVVDTGSGLTDETLAALEIATDVLFVTTMDISAVKALRRAIDLLDRIDLLPRNRHLVVNMTEPGTGLEVEDIAKAMRMPVDASVPRSVDIALSINLGKPIADGKRAGELSDAVGKLVAKITGQELQSRRGGRFRRDG